MGINGTTSASLSYHHESILGRDGRIIQLYLDIQKAQVDTIGSPPKPIPVSHLAFAENQATLKHEGGKL
jgi:hypothetical protein